MCDDLTAREEEAALAARGLSRRDFAAQGAAVAMAAFASPAIGKTPRLRESMVRVNTPDGYADAFFVHPARGRHPGVIVWPDIAGLRDVFKIMARKLASAGFSVLVMNQYYRSAPSPVLGSFLEWRTPEGGAKLRPMIARVTPEATIRDAAACVAFLDAQARVDTRRKIGTQGYCMGGSHAIRTAAAVPTRIGAAASFHGGGIANDKPDSPHLLLPQTQAAFLIAVARDDDARDSGEKDRFTAAARAVGRTAEAVVYQANHGWCVPDTPAYDAGQADLAWEQLIGLYMGL